VRKETLQNLLHRFSPEWDASVVESRDKLGFSFDLGTQERWDWFACGKHIQVRNSAYREMKELGLPGELAEYWICCFYSNYRQPSGLINLTAVEGPPFLELPCPSSFLDERWTASIEEARSKLMSKHRLKQESDLTSWFWNVDASTEVGIVALEEVKNLHLPEPYAMAWICCFLPPGAKWMADRSLPVVERFHQFADWRQFICTGDYQRRRVRAYPFVIDWNEDADEKYRESTTMWDLRERGMNLGIESDSVGNMTMTLSWRPELVRIDELRKAVEYAQRYYHHMPGLKGQTAPLYTLIKQFVNRAKVIPINQRKQSARVRYQSEEATFEQLLCEEALTPEVQKEYQEYVSTYRQSPARRKPALKEIRSLRKEVYDRVRSWLIEAGQPPKVQRHPPWWSEVLPEP